MLPSPLGRWMVICISWIVTPAVASGGAVATDGSLGPARTLTGPTFLVTPDLGKQVGSNLFQSLATLNLDKGQSAVFSGPATVQNVFARVTGGAASNIDGTIQCTIPAANFYLINPAGVVFGPDAKLNVGGSFAVSSADYVRLADGAKFNSVAGAPDAVLTTAAPAAFGFLTTPTNGVTSNGALLKSSGGAVLSLIGGPVSVNGGQLLGTGGRINLLSAAAPGEITVDSASNSALPDFTNMPTRGGITLGGGGLVDASGPSAGSVVIAAGSLAVQMCNIVSHSNGAGKGGDINLDITGAFSVQDASIDADTGGVGAGGNIRINAGSVDVSSGGTISVNTGSMQSNIGGPGGTISITAGSLTMQGPNARIGAQTASNSVGGQIIIQVSGAVQLTDDAAIVSTAFSAGNGGSILLNANSITLQSADPANPASISANTTGTGAGGNLNLSGSQLQVFTNGQISANSGMPGAKPDSPGGMGGVVKLNFDSILVSGTKSRIIAETYASGPGGSVMLTANSLSLMPGSALAVSSFGNGQGGSANLAADTLQMAGTMDLPTLIAGRTFGPAPGAALLLTGTTLSIGPYSQITTSSQEPLNSATPGGRSGDATLNYQTIFMTGPQARLVAQTTTSGGGGNLFINATTLSLTDDSVIGTNTLSSGHGGMIQLAAHAVTLQSSSATDLATISAATQGAGDGGSVNLSGKKLQVLSNSQITVDTGQPGIDPRTQTGNGGSALLNFDSITLSGMQSRIVADTYTASRGGNISIITKNLGVLPGGAIGASTFGGGPSGGANIAADTLTMAGASDLPAAISARTFGPAPGGSIDITGNALSVGSFSQIAASSEMPLTGGPGGGTSGNATLNFKDIHMFGSQSRIVAQTRTPGNGGTLSITATDNLTMTGDSAIAASTFDAGTGGVVNVNAGAITLHGARRQLSTSQPRLAAQSSTVATAGAINVSGRTLAISDGGFISVANSSTGNAGDLSIAMLRTVSVIHGSISVAAPGGAEGNLLITAPLRVELVDTELDTLAKTQTASVIIGKPPVGSALPALQYVVLNDTRIATAGGQGGNVTIYARHTLESADSKITSVGSITILGVPDTDVAGAMAPLNTGLTLSLQPLIPVCATRLEADFSSFVITGQGSRPPQPAGWIPDLVTPGR